MYFQIFYKKTNGFNMACYTQILISMKESFIVKCPFLWSTLEH